MNQKKRIQKVGNAKKKKNEGSWAISCLFGIILIMYINNIADSNPGYSWFKNSLLKGNLEVINKFKDLDHKKRLELKLGLTGSYINYIRERTPDNAIIIFPPDSALDLSINNEKLRQNQRLLKYIKNKVWITYYLYPRKVVYEREKNNSECYSKATHVAIISSWGYDLLNYQVKGKAPLTVLPIELKK